MPADLPPDARALLALAAFRPDQTFTLTPLSVREETAVFHAVPTGRGRSFTIKLALTRHEATRLVRQARRQRAVWATLQGPTARVPQLFRINRDLWAAISEHVPGQSHAQTWSPSTAQGLCHKAGLWLRAFHATTGSQQPFDPRPMIAWLPASAPANLLPRLLALADTAREAPVQSATLHADFHPGNIISIAEASYGLDLENDKAGATLRDALSYLIDASLRGGTPATLGAALAATLHDPTAPPVARFLECHAAIAQLSRLGPPATWGPNRAAKAKLLHALASGEVTFFPP